MCGGAKGPSAGELVAQENAARSRAQAEADKLKAERELQKQQENARVVSDQVTQANLDAARRARNRTLLAGLAEEEGTGTSLDPLEDETSNASKKAKRSTLIGSLGGGI